jgi:hypothetical protein
MDDALIMRLMVLGGMAFCLVTLVLYTLAHQLSTALQRHDLIRQARLQQQEYLRTLAERRRDAGADYDALDEPINVDFDEPDPVAEPMAQAA